MKVLKVGERHSKTNKELWKNLMRIWFFDGDFIVEHLFETENHAQKCGKKNLEVRLQLENATVHHMSDLYKLVTNKLSTKLH